MFVNQEELPEAGAERNGDEPPSRVPRFLGCLILAAAVTMPGSGTAATEKPFSPGAALTDFFRWEESIPPPRFRMRFAPIRKVASSPPLEISMGSLQHASLNMPWTTRSFCGPSR